MLVKILPQGNKRNEPATNEANIIRNTLFFKLVKKININVSDNNMVIVLALLIIKFGFKMKPKK